MTRQEHIEHLEDRLQEALECRDRSMADMIMLKLDKMREGETK